MTSISSHAQKPRTPQAIKAARSWSLRSLQISEQALQEGAGAKDAAMAICARARCVALHNMGMLAEVSRLGLTGSGRAACRGLKRADEQMEGDKTAALNHFSEALSAARETGFTEAKREATDAIRRVKGS